MGISFYCHGIENRLNSIYQNGMKKSENDDSFYKFFSTVYLRTIMGLLHFLQEMGDLDFYKRIFLWELVGYSS